MKKQRSASPSQAMPMSAFVCDDALDDVAAVLFDERVGLVIGERAVDLEAQTRRRGRADASKSFGATSPAMPLPRVEHHVERLDDAACR